MIELKRIVTDYDHDLLCFTTEDGSFVIKRDEEDLYFEPISASSINDNKDGIYTYHISDGNCGILKVLDSFYEAVKEKKPYKNSIYDFLQDDFQISEYDERVPEYVLFKNDKVEWHSDAMPYRKSSSLIIEKGEDEYTFSFKPGKDSEDGLVYGVEVSYPSLRYRHFGKTFNNMY